MRLFAFCLFCLGFLWCNSCEEPLPKRITKRVITHDHITIVCNPVAGNNPYAAWGVFPKPEEQVRRIFMDITLGHPDAINIAHWDYLDPIKIKRVGGEKGDTLNLEIGKMLTPYGSNFKKDWRWHWRIDVTDFSSVLRDSVEIEYNHSGYEATKVGWDLELGFELEMGNPIANNLGYQELYHDRFNYGNPEKPITESLAPKQVRTESEATFGRLRVLHTGHGADKPKGCSEFCSRWREVLLDGKAIDHRDMWKECADNNLYPQGGTWIFDRAYWCPGDLQSPDIIDFPITQATHTLDLEMEPYTATENIQAQEAISAVLFQYGAPAQTHDVSLEQILVPNHAPELNRMNPAAIEPRIRIKNLGSETLTKLTIVYGTENFEPKTFEWTGQLDFYQEEMITLPGSIDFAEGGNTFFAHLKEPNEKPDAWLADNRKESRFSPVKEMPQQIIVQYKSNHDPTDNFIEIRDADKNLVYERLPEDTAPNTLYKDTVSLAEGHYRMILKDTVHNGLEFWFMPKQGFGYLQLRQLDGRVLHKFESDCGVGEQLDFTVKQQPRLATQVEQDLIKLHPRLVTTETELYLQLEQRANGEVKLLKNGEPITQWAIGQVKDSVIKLDMSPYEEGRYVIELFLDGESKLKQRISKWKGKF
jgi:hypothetical protein